MADPRYQSALPLPGPEEAPLPPATIVQIDQEGDGSKTSVNPKTGVAKIEFPDGSVVIYPNGLPPKKPAKDFDDWNRNLVDEIDPHVLNGLVDDLLLGIQADDQSRREYLEDLAQGLKMLGFKLETPGADGASAGAPAEGMSRVYHPLMQEAVLRFQANARGELLPASGPVKVEDSGDDQGEGGDDLAQELENGFNHFLTVTASEYYPDTIRMLFSVGFGGSGFKKVFHDPVRQRPASESVDASHLIVSNNAIDLRNCDRITHLIDDMMPSTLRRMQILGVYRDVPLSDAWGTTDNPVDLVKQEIVGLNPSMARPEDKPHMLYEVRCKLDVEGFEDVDDKGDPTGLRLPWKVTIHKESRECLEWRRDWREDDPRKLPKRTYVKYPYVEAMGFYGIGLFHILCNPTRALTAMWRIAIDNGMFGNFPGGLIDKAAARQLSADFMIRPGNFLPIDLGSKRMVDVVGPVPYRDISPAFMSLITEVSQTAQRVGGTAELPVGEGRQDAPVGTTIALLEQATKITDSVHKGLHAAQAEEFQILKELFREDPEAFWRHRPGETATWNTQKLLAALDRCDLVPVADPNTPTHMHRLMKVQGLVQLAQLAPDIVDRSKVAAEAIRTLGYSDAQAFMVASPQQQPDPKAQAALVSAQAAMVNAQAKQADLAFKQKNSAVEDQNRDKDRESKMFIAKTQLSRDAIIHGQKTQAEQMMQSQALQADHAAQAADHQHEQVIQARDYMAERQAQMHDSAVAAATGQRDRTADALAQQRDHAAAAIGQRQDHIADHIGRVADHRHDAVMRAMEIANQPKPAAKGKPK